MADEYEIHTIGDMLKVPADKREQMVVDLLLWLELHDEMEPLISAGLVSLSDRMTWVDDDKRGLSELTVTFDRTDGLGYDTTPTPDAPEPMED